MSFNVIRENKILVKISVNWHTFINPQMTKIEFRYVLNTEGHFLIKNEHFNFPAQNTISGFFWKLKDSFRNIHHLMHMDFL